MILVSYDISDNKLRSKFSKYLKRFGHRVQYSIFEIDNSDKILNVIYNDINNKWSNKFSETDSVMVFKLSKHCKVMKFGYSVHEDEDLIII